MKRVCLFVVLAFLALGPACRADRAAAESSLSVMTDRDHLNVGQTVQIEVRLWSVMEGRVLPPLGGEIKVAVIDALRGTTVRTFRAEPDGSAQRFKVAWSPWETGGYRIVAGYENLAAGERLWAETPVTVGLGVSESGTAPSAPPTTIASTWTPPSTAGLPDPPPASPAPGAVSPVPASSEGSPTRVGLGLEPGAAQGEYVVRISVTTASGRPVERGDVLVTVSRGSLSRGYGTQAMAALDRRGRVSLGWIVPPGKGGSDRVTVDYLGGWSSEEEYNSSSAGLDLERPRPIRTTAVPTASTLPPATWAASTTTIPPVTTTTIPAAATTTLLVAVATTIPVTNTARPSPPLPSPVVGGETITNTIGMVFRLIPAGRFGMGSPGGRNSPRFARPVHEVELSRSFWLGIHEVTQGQWRKIMHSRPAKFRGGPDRPVERVSFVQVREFIRRLNAKEGTRAYRLPTEAEWEYACRAGTRTPWSFGSRPGQLSDYAWWISNSELKTHPVGLLRPNPWGLFDMHGNVAELCSDWFGRDYYGKSPGRDPGGPAQGVHRVGRGGSWLSGPTRLRCAARIMAESGPSLGFRLVKER